MTSSQPKQPLKGLPNPYGILPNPYQLQADVQAPPIIFAEQAKAEQKKTVPRFHNPHSIKRPQAKGNNAVKKPTRPVMAVNAVEHTPTSTTQQKPIEWYINTVEDDAEINDARVGRAWEERQQLRESKRIAKKWGPWYPEKEHQASRYTNITAYTNLGGYDEVKKGFRKFLEEAKLAGRNQTDSSSPPEESQRSSQSGPTSPTNDVSVASDHTGDEAYARRVRLSSTLEAAVPPPPPPPPRSPPPSEDVIPPPPPPPTAGYNPTISALPVTYSHTISAPPVTYSHTISSAPVHYPQPEAQKVLGEEPPARESYDERPTKKVKLSYGARMLAKMGHKEGEGLGKNSDGITTHLEAVKRKGQSKLDDNGDRDRVRSAQVFDIRGGHRTAKPEESKFGKPSRVIVTWGCCDGIDLAADADRNDGGIRQEMGEAFQAKFGTVERIYYNVNIPSPPVYIEFVDGLSALNAVNRFDEGYEFQGRKIKAQFYMAEKFQAFVYDY